MTSSGLATKAPVRNAAAKDEALAGVKRKKGELADLAGTAGEAERLLAYAKRAIRKAKADAAAADVAG